MEMAICRLYQQSSFVKKGIPKILYIAPIKQLVTEKRLEWERCQTREYIYCRLLALTPRAVAFRALD
jgi:replicative superfamily II helicase